MEKEIINWEETEKLIEKLASQIKAEGFSPTIIAPVPRGGWCVASILAQKFNLKKTLGISHYMEEEKIKVQLSADKLKNENVLLVEDSIETGKTLYAIEKELIKLGAKVKTVCIYVSSKSRQEKKPDFYIGIKEIPNFVWEI